jgi:hypothetical protein
MSASSQEKSSPVVSKRGLGIAGLAAIVGCAVCCAVPLLAAAGLGGGAIAALSSVFRPGSELLVGGTVFALVLGASWMRNRLRREAASGCGPSCNADGSCCDRGAGTKNT